MNALRRAALLLMTAVLTACAPGPSPARAEADQPRLPEITAHRGASADYPENTMAAFRGAWELGADWIELDVHESSDRVVYCMHDAALARTTGSSAHAWELTWNEIRQLDAGSHFDARFAGEPPPALEEVIQFAIECGIRLNIELKPDFPEQPLEEDVIALIRRFDFADRCVITCQRYASVEKVKALAPELTTVFVLSMVFADLERYPAADHFSISWSFINAGLVSRLHMRGKKVYAWTVDSPEALARMAGWGVDNIITSRVSDARAWLGSQKENAPSE